MTAGNFTNASAGLIRFRQYRQLCFLRPSSPPLNAGNDLHSRHANPSDLELMPALMPVLISEHRPFGPLSKKRSPDAH
ncbi:hypothetical protein, partial [Rhizobium aquaticum]|uniref:hypothetical protein n=1 Tax=Rhizobium aquaticum TaxID=1549636 RepID=UPI0033961258